MSEIDMENVIDKKVGSIVAKNFRAAKVLSGFGIDFCCQGGTTLKAACAARGLDEDVVVNEIIEALQKAPEQDFANMDAQTLIGYIVNHHHAYVRSTIPALLAYLGKVSQVHGEAHPELHEIFAEFTQAAEALQLHMQKEEMVLFPYILAMDQALTHHLELSSPHFGHISNPITMMEAEHESEGIRLKKLRLLSSDYTCPAGACQTYQVSFAMLKDFEEDLYQHIHLENNILFPMAINMYKSLGF